MMRTHHHRHLPDRRASSSSILRRLLSCLLALLLIGGVVLTTFWTVHVHWNLHGDIDVHLSNPIIFLPGKAAGVASDESALLLASRQVEGNPKMTATNPMQQQTEGVIVQEGLLTVIVPIYKGYDFIDLMIQTFKNQTYLPQMEILISIEPSEEAELTETTLRRYQSEEPSLNLQIFRQQHRLLFPGNMNFLWARARGQYLGYHQCDDTLPPNYYEELVKCLINNPQAVNCYPYIVAKYEEEGMTIVDQHQESLVGPQHERVDKVLKDVYWIPQLGVTRRYHRAGYQHFNGISRYYESRLHKSFTSSDLVSCLKKAIDGELIEVPHVPYYKYFHKQSYHISQFHNASVMARTDLMLSVLDLHVRRYNIAHSYVSSSQSTADLMEQSLRDSLREHLQSYGRGGKKKGRDVAKLRKEIDDFIHLHYWKRIQQPRRVAVLGAGIQGCMLALMFRKHGYDVTLIGKASDIMSQASAGRVHTGLFQYSSMDLTMMRTGEHMLEAALQFASYMEYLVGRKIDWHQIKSERITAVLGHDSTVSPHSFEDYADQLNSLYEEKLAEDPSLSYLGERPPKLLGERANPPKVMNTSFVAATYDSVEVAIDTHKLREILREALEEQQVNIVLNRNVLGVKRNKPGFESRLGRLKVVSDVSKNDYDVVVNTFREGSATIDQKMGVATQPENYHIKTTLRLPSLPSNAEVPTVSIMNGPSGGDITRYGPDDPIYFSWNPVSVQHISNKDTKYESLAMGDFSEEFHSHITEGHKATFQMLFPGLDDSYFDSATLSAVYVLSNESPDIDDGSPNLIHDGYISVKTPTLTCVPYNTYQLEKEIFIKDTLLADV